MNSSRLEAKDVMDSFTSGDGTSAGESESVLGTANKNVLFSWLAGHKIFFGRRMGRGVEKYKYQPTSVIIRDGVPHTASAEELEAFKRGE